MIRTILTLFIVFTSLVSFAQKSGDGVAAIINGEAVTYFDILSYNRFNESQLVRKYSGKELEKKIVESRQRAVKEFIDQKILLNEFKEKEYQIPRFIIEERIDKIIRQQAGGDRVAFKKQLKKQEISWQEYRDQLKDRIAVNMMLSQFVYNNIKVDDDEIREYVNAHKAELTKPGQRNLALLLLLKNGKYANKLDDTAKEVVEKMQSGTSFADLVKEYSEGPFKDKDGNMGWIEDKNVRKECQEIVFALEKDEVSKPMTLEEGHVALFKLIDKKAPISDPNDPQIKAYAERVLRKQKEDKTYAEYLENIRSKNIIKDFASE